jgi:hypothetical protein
MTTFAIRGPYKIDYENRKGGRALSFDDFWSEESEAYELAEERGCYVFAIRNKGLTPIYVGKATKSFRQETFNQANRHKYSDGFSEYGRGTPVMYFVVHAAQRGPTNAKQIAEIEDFLIQAGVAKNPNIQNVRGAQQPLWSIKGVIRSGHGRPNKTEQSFRTLFDIRR